MTLPAATMIRVQITLPMEDDSRAVYLEKLGLTEAQLTPVATPEPIYRDHYRGRIPLQLVEIAIPANRAALQRIYMQQDWQVINEAHACGVREDGSGKPFLGYPAIDGILSTLAFEGYQKLYPGHGCRGTDKYKPVIYVATDTDGYAWFNFKNALFAANGQPGVEAAAMFLNDRPTIARQLAGDLKSDIVQAFVDLSWDQGAPALQGRLGRLKTLFIAVPEFARALGYSPLEPDQSPTAAPPMLGAAPRPLRPLAQPTHQLRRPAAG